METWYSKLWLEQKLTMKGWKWLVSKEADTENIINSFNEVWRTWGQNPQCPKTDQLWSLTNRDGCFATVGHLLGLQISPCHLPCRIFSMLVSVLLFPLYIIYPMKGRLSRITCSEIPGTKMCTKGSIINFIYNWLHLQGIWT